jgi:hypothetical protein
MAVFNEIDEGGLNGILTARLGMPGGSPAPSLAPEIMPQLVLENDRPEWGWNKGEMRCAGHFSVLAAVGQYGIVQFYNPPGSNSIAVIDYVENIGTPDIFVQRSSPAILAAGTTVYGGVCDLRFPFRTHSLLVTTLTAAAYPAAQGVFCYLNANLHPFTGSLVLKPNTLVIVASASLNANVDFNLRWYERVAQSGELG